MRKYRLTVQTTSTGNARWLDDYLMTIERHYGCEFADKLRAEGRAELRSKDPDGAEAVSVYELATIA